MLATFGRGFYVLDDLTPAARGEARPTSSKERALFPVKKARAYIPSVAARPQGEGLPGRDVLHRAQPAVRRRLHLLPEGRDHARRGRRACEAEKEAAEEGRADRVPDAGRAARRGARGGARRSSLTVTDADGQRRAPAHRPASRPASTASRGTCASRPRTRPRSSRSRPRPRTRSSTRPPGPLAAPGTYTVSLEKRVDGALDAARRAADVRGRVARPADADGRRTRPTLLAFQRKTARLQRAVLGAVEAAEEAQGRIKAREEGGRRHARPPTRSSAPRRAASTRRSRTCSSRCAATRSIRARNEPTPLSIVERVAAIVGGQWSTTVAPTGTSRQAYDVAADAFETQLGRAADAGRDRPARARGRWSRRARRGRRAACRPGRRSSGRARRDGRRLARFSSGC